MCCLMCILVPRLAALKACIAFACLALLPDCNLCCYKCTVFSLQGAATLHII